jgi:type I restriction enzyme S subunit
MNKTNHIPPGYKASPLGPIPTDWEVKEFGEVADIFVGRDLKESNYQEIIDDEYSIPVYSNTVENEGLYGYYNVEEYNGESLTVVGRGVGLGTAFTRSGKYGAIGRLLVIFPNGDNVAHYLTEYINGKLKLHTESSGIPQLTGEQFSKYKILVPPYKEQTAIANLLSTWDKAIQTTAQLIAQKEQLKKWLMQQLLTGKKRLKGFRGKWNEVRLGEVAEVDKNSLGNQTPPDYSFQYLSLSDVDTGIAEIKSERIIFKEAPSRARRIVKKGDILLATVRPNLQGFVIIKEDVKDLIASTGFAVITCYNINSDFLFQFLFTRNLMKQIEALLVGSNYPAINSSDVEHLKIPYPPYEEQTAIAAVLQAADKEIQLLKAKAEQLKEQKKGLMQILLTGKKRLNYDLND